jgi:hypothetical protein
MLTRAIMGSIALAILWVNTLLIAAAAAKELLRLEERRARLKPRKAGDSTPGYGLIHGRVAEGNGPEGALARHRVEQVGRSAGDPEAQREIVFADRTIEGEVLGGSVQVEGEEEVILGPASGSAAEVWVSEAALREAAACPGAMGFDAAYAEARKARGFVRAVEVALRPGQEVWVAGEITRRGRDAALFVAPSRSFGMLVAAVDPRAILARKIALSIAALVGILGGAAGATALALTQPYFGPVSTLGAALGLGFFILVQPAGTALRDAVLLPHRAFVRGAWTRPPGGLGEEPLRGRRTAAERAPTAAPKAHHAPPPPAP